MWARFSRFPTASVVSMVGHGHSEVHSLVGEFTQNLHIVDIVFQAEEDRLQSRGEYSRLVVFSRPSANVLDVL